MSKQRLLDPLKIVKESWDIAGRQRLFWVGMSLIYLMINGLINRFFGVHDYHDRVAFLRVAPINIVLSTMLTIATVRMGLLAVSGKTVEVDDLWKSIMQLPKYLAASLLFAIMVSIGFIALILPGLYLAIRLSQFGFFILDRDANVIDSLRLSWEATKGQEFWVFVTMLVLILTVALGILALGVGILFTLPIGIIGSAFMFRQLTAK